MGHNRGLRRRRLVNEMELFNLYKEIAQLRNQEAKALYFARFKKLLAESEKVQLTVIPNNNESRDK